MNLTSVLADDNALQQFFGNCITIGQERKLPIDSFFPVPVLFALASTLASIALINGPVTKATSGSKAVKLLFVLVAAACTAAQIVSESITLARNIGTYDANIGQATQFATCALTTLGIVDLSAVDVYMRVLEALHHAVAIATSLLFFVALCALNFRYQRFSLPVRFSLPLAILYLSAFALSALLLLPVRPSAYGCAFNSDADAYVCRADYWRENIDNPIIALSRNCDFETQAALESGEAGSCKWRPIGKLFHAFAERLLQFILSAYVVSGKSIGVGVLAVLALIVQVAYLFMIVGRRRKTPPPNWLAILVLAFVALHTGGWLFLEVEIVRMFRLARGSIACGCTGDADTVIGSRNSVLVAVASLLDGLKLVFTFARHKGSRIPTEHSEVPDNRQLEASEPSDG